ncbi:MAG: type I pullulanase [Bacteroidetes bacterium]|nr:type I pullulanase [Bacteroidota bacterium]
MRQLFITSFLIFVLSTLATSQVDDPKIKVDDPAMEKKSSALNKKKPQLRNFTDAELNAFPNYSGTDLGLNYRTSKSTFKIWSPPAAEVLLFFYDQPLESAPIAKYNMKKGKNGIWEAKVKGNQAGKYYDFQIRIDSIWLKNSVDPYAKAVGTNGERAMVVDLKKTNPVGWDSDKRPLLKSFADIILYELQLRDISVAPSSGIKNKGKFLGLAETGTKSPEGLPTGIDHIKELGVTHVHILPAFDFRSIDERPGSPITYNWGYDPQNYNSPEGSFSTDPADGAKRIQEFKTMVKALHDNGLRVVMDVVYNHTGSTENSVFSQTVPYYYYRRYPNGFYSDASACGNEVASERPMVRKFMIESMLYWAKEYHIDGFRLDLMGIHDIETMNELAAALRKVDPTIFLYGEGWTAGSSPLPEEKRAVKANVLELDGIAAFSDEFRDGVKGHVFKPSAKGFINGEDKLVESVKFGIVGGVSHPQVDLTQVNYTQKAWAKTPQQCINYVSCHDNNTLWDRLTLSCKTNSEQEKLNMDKLAQTIVLTSQGVPFLFAGEEFVRSKQLIENSFNSPDEFNQIDWGNKSKYNDLFQYYQNLIELRKAHPAFRMTSQAQIAEHLKFVDLKFEHTIGYILGDHANGDTWKRILVIFNGNPNGKQIYLPDGNWKIICTNNRIDMNGMGMNDTGFAMVGPFSAYILVEE